MLDSCLRGSPHVENRIKRARRGFYALTPAGIFNSRLSPIDKVFLWRAVVLPALLFGCDVAPLRAPDVLRLEKCQASSIKAALGLPQKAHHHALLKGLGVPSIQVLLRKGIFGTVRSSFQEDHRLRQALACSVDEFVRRPSSLSGSFLGQVMDMCNGRLDRLLSIVLGHIPPALFSSPECADGVADSIRTASTYAEPTRSTILFLLCKPY